MGTRTDAVSCIKSNISSRNRGYSSRPVADSGQSGISPEQGTGGFGYANEIERLVSLMAL